MSADLDDRVEAWIEAEWSEYAGQLTPSDLRRGIQGLSGLYVHDRSKGQISARAGAGAARAERRAAALRGAGPGAGFLLPIPARLV